MVLFPGVTTSEARFAALTFSDVLALVAPDVAVIVTVPRFKAVARPLVVIEAMFVPEEVHVTMLVMSWVVPSENDPVAVYCCKTPRGTERFTGVTLMEFKVALVTVRAAIATMAPDVAVIVDEPATNAFANPLVGTVSLMVATVVEEDVQVTLLVTSLMLPSVNVPVAVKGFVVVGAMEAVNGFTTIEVKVGAVTVSAADPLMEPEVAMMLADPCV